MKTVLLLLALVSAPTRKDIQAQQSALPIEASDTILLPPGNCPKWLTISATPHSRGEHHVWQYDWSIDQVRVTSKYEPVVEKVGAGWVIHFKR